MRFSSVILLLCHLCHFTAGEVIAQQSPSEHPQPCRPYQVGLHWPKLTTPQWVGDSDVDAVVILSIDDMRETAKYEAFLRPLLNRLKKIDGRAPISIFTNLIDPKEPQLQAWLDEGLSLEVHTVDHPCPLLGGGDFAKAKSTYDRCVNMMAEIPDSQPVAFRMPCCDSLNTPSPRFWTEIFEKQTASSNFLSIDSSVFNIFTADDPDLTPDITLNENGAARFRHYLPFKSFVNTIENYPYPYIVGRSCWEFPCVVPSDWEAQNVQRPNNPETVRDLKRALDATVIKQGVMPIVFHPHGWIRAAQLVEFVNYADQKYGKRVKFLNFAESLQRINKNLLGGAALRTANGNEHNVRLVDVDRDGYFDVVRRAERKQLDKQTVITRVWQRELGRYKVDTIQMDFSRAVFFHLAGDCFVLAPEVDGLSAYKRDQNGWVRTRNLFNEPDWGAEFRDLSEKSIDDIQAYDIDGDGSDELILTHQTKTVVLGWQENKISRLPYDVPAGLLTQDGDPNAGVRLVNLNGDGCLDIVKSNGNEYGVWLFVDNKSGWKQVRSGIPTDRAAIPMIARPDGTNNGAWFHSDHLWVQNEFTDRKADLVDRVAFSELVTPPADSSTEHPLGKAKTIDESLATFALPAGTKLEVAAAEPQVQDPIAFDFSPSGELWVVEMGDYPNGANWHGPGDKQGDPGGRVKKLVDVDGDGRFETSHLFLDGLSWPTGVKAWRNGVLVSVPPDIIYAADLDGDNKADHQEVLYTGMHTGNQQHRANGFRWGLDHWIHLANGDSGGVVRSTKTGDEVNTSGRDFRIAPDQGLIEPTSGPTQFGRTRDDRGNWFGGNNSNPVWHYVLNEKYLGRNPYFNPPSARVDVAEVPGAAPVFPKSETVERFNDFDRANRFTSACSPEIYRNNSVYVCEPVHNLVHRSILRADGATFASARRADERQSEFLASSDNWFRPVMVRAGPDRAIWVADMYRMVVEHPEWIPMQWQKRIDHLNGNDKGRIYRIVLPESESGRAAMGQQIHDWKKIQTATAAELVGMLDTDIRVLRDMVQQEIVTRNDSASVPHLKRLRSESTGDRIAIDYLLAHFNALDYDQLESPNDLHLHTLRLIEPKLEKSKKLRDLLIEFGSVHIPDEQLRMQTAYTLGHCDDARTGGVLARIALNSLSGEHDRYIRAAVMSSVSDENIEQTMMHFLAAEIPAASRPAAIEFLDHLVRSAIGFDNKPAIRTFLNKATASSDTLNPYSRPIASLLRSFKSDKKNLREFVGVEGAAALQRIAGKAIDNVANDRLSARDRLMSLQMFGFFPELQDSERHVLRQLLMPTQTQQLQRKAIELLAELDPQASSTEVFARWDSFTPALRDVTLAAAIHEPSWTAALLSGMEDGAILPVQISVRYRQQLIRHDDETIRNRASKIFQKVESNRDSVVRKYASSRSSNMNVAQGKQVFSKHCASCHQLEEKGTNIGPDLTAISDKSMPAMLTAILDPNLAVEEKYLDYNVLTTSGQIHHGILVNESATAISLATPEGKTVSILRNQLEQLKATGKSLMPEGLEQVLSPQDVTDVVGYVQSIAVPRKQFPGNIPQLAPVRNDGSIRLFAIHAEIYGPNIVLEERYHNLGFWSDHSDRAVWTIDAPSAGEYELHLDYACAPQPAMNRFQIRADGQVLGGEVDSTQSWDHYRGQKVGTLKLPDEPVQLAI